VGAEENVKPVSADGTTPVEDFYRFSIVVAGDEHFSAKAVPFVSRNEDIIREYFVTAGRWAA
jgi:hypothetical protein